MDGTHMTRRNRILKALSLILPAGALGASVALALTCSDAMAAQDKTSAPDQTSQESIATRLQVIRTGVSSIADSTEMTWNGTCSRRSKRMPAVAKGAAAPTGKSAAEIVKEEQLPAATRVIKSTDGIPSADSNPNRLTLVLSKDGRISTAIWE
jgi:hypothetical protein